MSDIRIRFVCQDLSGNIFCLYYYIDEFINGFNLARNWRIEKILSKDLFTGEFDNNKKEIYNGDRVLVDTTGINYLPDNIQGIVKFIDGCFTVVFDKAIYDKPLGIMRNNLYVKCFVVNHTIQVIGNVHETLE